MCSWHQWRSRLRLLVAAVKGDLDFDSPLHWFEDELRVRRLLRPEIVDTVGLARDLEGLSYDLMSAEAFAKSDAEVFRVHVTLLARTLQDLRASVSCALSGYTMQSWTLAASAFEAANMMGFVGGSSDRATQWLDHTDLDRSLANVKVCIHDTLEFLELGQDLAQGEYELYKYLCIAKHANPVSEKNRYVFLRGSSPIIRLTPIYKASRLKEAKLGLALGCRAAVISNWVFFKTHFENESELGDRLLGCAKRSLSALQNWKEEADTLGEEGDQLNGQVSRLQ